MSLSDKKTYSFDGVTEYCYPEKDVKEAVRELKEEFRKTFENAHFHVDDLNLFEKDLKIFERKINKIFGEDLT